MSLSPAGLAGCSDIGNSTKPAEIGWEGTEVGWKQVCVGHTIGCGIRGNGAIQCWPEDDPTAYPVPEGTFRHVYSSWGGSCAVRDDGTVLSWGDRGWNNERDPSIPWPLPASQVWCPGTGMMMVTTDAELAFVSPQLELAPALMPGIDITATPAVGGGWPPGFRCAHILRPEGEVRNLCEDPTLALTPPEPVVEIEAILGGLCGRTGDGRIVCDTLLSEPEELFEALLTSLVAARSIVCGLDEAGMAHCVQTEATESQSHPPLTPPDTPFRSIAGMDETICGITVSDTLACWGANLSGEGQPP